MNGNENRNFLTSVSCERIQMCEKKRNFSSVLDVRRPFRAKGFKFEKKKRNFSSVFDVRRPFRAKGSPQKKKNRNFSSVFDVRRPFRAKGVEIDTSKSQFYLSF